MFRGRRKVEFFVPRFGHDLLSVPNETPVHLKIFPPYRRTAKGLDLDLSGLLVSDVMVIDKHAAEVVSDRSNAHLTPMRETLSELLDCGRVRIADYSKLQSEFEPSLRRWVSEQIDHPTRWMPSIRRQYQSQIGSVREQLAALSLPYDATLEELPFGVVSAMTKTGSPTSQAESRRLMKLFWSRRRRLTAMERDVLIEIVRPYVTQTATDVLLSQKLEMPFLSWESDDPIYELLVVPDVRERPVDSVTRDQLEACRDLLNDVIPEVRPISVAELNSFSKDKAARRALIFALHQATATGVPITREQIDAIQRALILSGLSLQRRSRLISLCVGIVGFPASFLPLVGSILYNLFGLAAGEVGNIQPRNPHLWYSTLLSVTSKHRAEGP